MPTATETPAETRAGTRPTPPLDSTSDSTSDSIAPRWRSLVYEVVELQGQTPARDPNGAGLLADANRLLDSDASEMAFYDLLCRLAVHVQHRVERLRTFDMELGPHSQVLLDRITTALAAEREPDLPAPDPPQQRRRRGAASRYSHHSH